MLNIDKNQIGISRQFRSCAEKRGDWACPEATKASVQHARWSGSAPASIVDTVMMMMAAVTKG
jgi:hypothetical protein